MENFEYNLLHSGCNNYTLIGRHIETLKNNLFSHLEPDVNKQKQFFHSDFFINELARYLPAVTTLPVPCTQDDFDTMITNLKLFYFNEQHKNGDLKYLETSADNILVPRTVEEVIRQLFIFGEERISLQNLWSFSEALSNPTLFVRSLIEVFRNNNFAFHQEWAQGLFDYYHPYIESAKTTKPCSDYHLLILDLFVAIILRYPKDEFSFQIFAYRIFNDFLSICRRSTGKMLIHAFRCISELYTKVGRLLIEESLNKIIVDIVLTFTPTHQLFHHVYYLIQQTPEIYDDVKYLKLLIRLKVSVTMQTFEFIDAVLCAHSVISKPLIIVQFLMQQCVTKQVWSLVAANIIQKHARLFLQSKRTREWMKIYVRRTLQWISIVAKLRKYKNRRFLIARSFGIFATCTPASIAEEIKTDASTLIQTGAHPELSYYFSAAQFDQTFLDEIEVLDVLPDLNEQLLWPKETLRSDQLQKMDALRNTPQPQRDAESLKILNDSSDTILDGRETIETSMACFYTLLFLLFTTFVLVIIS